MDADEGRELEQLRAERDLLLKLLDLAAREDLRPFLEEALASIVAVTGARKGYLEISGGAGGAPFWIASGFSDAEIADVRREISTGIVAEALATGRTISTASAIDDPRFRDRASVQAQRIRAVLCAPIGPLPSLGVLYLQGRDEPGPFPETDRGYAEVFARHLAPQADRLLARERKEEGIDHTAELRAELSVRDLAGRSQAMAHVFRQVLVAAPVPVAVLLTGESGTGKTALARALHESSPRRSGPFVEVNCAAIPETLFESELFGAEKGAHSTATRRLPGKIEAASGGTLFLDDVSEIPLPAQGKLLTFLQSHAYYRLGGTTPVKADVRVVAATNQSLEDLVRDKRFREDLYYRLNVLPIHVPPLRQRSEDIGAIADHVARQLGSPGEALPLSRTARVALSESEWPGNVRQLANAIQRGWAVARSERAPAIEPRHLFPERFSGADAPEGDALLSYQDALRRFQARYLGEALAATGWNVSETARRIGIARSHLNDLIRAHGLTRPEP
ncbi:MAG: sigma-54-dependent Fis family transcriptional regulator [Acidobacteriota bacterium]